MKKLITAIITAAFLLPSVSFASTLTQPQTDAIIGLLRAFNVEQFVVALVQTELAPPVASATGDTTALSLSANQLTVTANSVYLSWHTSIPAKSRVILTPVPATANFRLARVFQMMGSATQESIIIKNLTSYTQYSYTIEVTSGSQNKQLIGLLMTLGAAK